ncbi:unnamed protein product [Fusarium graminearum]|uniref:Uncharacterized protein n=1 Tax=Gibberella zeae TaxID=5518 RepID=A0A2H3G1B6_GIBZA|nr:hypothetical protein FGRA07_05096 [Fusarium graminearum]CAF3445963.1 unnamed protein product [Fusarium graminearum]CAG1965018.1 unnamed protein product [Fusarium graminearum]CAG2007759.1 unnamed protein product [Fusarium graminearum]
MLGEQGVSVNLTAPDDGDNVWSLQQVEGEDSAEYDENQSHQQINWSFGPIKLSGYVDTDTFEITINPNINGINAGDINGNLKDGVVLNVDLYTAKGRTKLYLKNGNETWVSLDLKIIFDGSFQGDYKTMTL